MSNESEKRVSDSMNNELPYGVQVKHITVNGTDIRYLEMDNPACQTMILLHGLASNSHTWKDVLPALNDHYRILAPDLPGHGYSGKPKRKYDLQYYLETVTGFADALKIKNAIWIGNSMGGTLSAGAALERPELVDKLILVDAAFFKRDHMKVVRKLLWALNLPARLMVGKSIVKRAVRNVYYNKQAVDDRLVMEYYAPLREKGAKRALFSTMRYLDFGNITERISEITQETLIIWGVHDAWLPAQMGEWASRQIPHASISLIEFSGHVPMEERPEEFLKAVFRFLQKG